MKISDLKYRQRRSGSEVSVSFDDGSAMALDAELSVRFHLALGLDLSADQVTEIQRADELVKARRRLIRYLSLRKKSALEARQYLQKAGFSAYAIEEATNAAKELAYIDDENYAEAFVRTRQRSGTKGPRRVTAELQARGISREEAQKVVAIMTEPETQMELARKVAAKKYPTIKDDADQGKASRKLAQHLARRGFDPDICDRVTREFFGDPTVF